LAVVSARLPFRLDYFFTTPSNFFAASSKCRSFGMRELAMVLQKSSGYQPSSENLP
jgi:hypothetical protein